MNISPAKIESAANNADVTCIVVTYSNRRTLLIEVLESLKTQKVGGVIVVDNGSEWAVKEELSSSYEGLVEVIQLPQNIGSAGGYAAGISYAIKSASKYIWLLDDDNKPWPDCLNNLLEVHNNLTDKYGDKKYALLAYRPDHQAAVSSGATSPQINTKKSSFLGFHLFDLPMKVLRRLPRIHRKKRRELPETVSFDVAPYSGLLFHRDIAISIGLPLEDFVLYADDTEYTYRITKNGRNILLVTNARIEDLESSWNIRKKGGTTFGVLLKQGSDFHAYYGMRNRTYFDYKILATNNFVFNANFTAYMFILWLTSKMCDREERYRLLREAAKDGLSGNLGINKKFPLR